MKPHWPSFFSGLTIGWVIGIIIAAGIYAVLKAVYA